MLSTIFFATTLLINPSRAGLGLQVKTPICTKETQNNCEHRIRRCGSKTPLGNPDIVQIKAKHGICLDATERTKRGGKVHMWECSITNTNQQWLYNRATGQIKIAANDKCLDASERNKTGGKVHMWDCSTSNKNQHWTYNEETGQIKATHGKCLDASRRNDKGGLVHMWNCDTNNKNQQWSMSKTFEAKYDLRPGATCAEGYEPLTTSWQDCESAARSMGITGDSVDHVDYDYPWGTNRPQGCFRSDGNNRIHFNRGAGGKFQGDDKILCIRKDPILSDNRWDGLPRITEGNCYTSGMMNKIDPYVNKGYVMVEFDDYDENCYEALVKPGECWGEHPETEADYGCQGRCGAGCGGNVCSNWGPGCLSHDVCSWYFASEDGAFDTHCGDEYIWAAQQTLEWCFWPGQNSCELSEHSMAASKSGAICH